MILLGMHLERQEPIQSDRNWQIHILKPISICWFWKLAMHHIALQVSRHGIVFYFNVT
jgi:hypothetical protein